MTTSKKPTLATIRKSVEQAGGSYEKANVYLNGKQAWRVNGILMTKEDMIARFMINAL